MAFSMFIHMFLYICPAGLHSLFQVIYFVLQVEQIDLYWMR